MLTATYLKWLYISKNMEQFSYKGCVAYIGMCILQCLKEEPAWAIDKRPHCY